MNHNRIMILSHEEELCKELGSYLKESKYGVTYFTDYTEALTALLDGGYLPDVVLFEVGIPSGKEYDLIRQIREKSDVYLIVLSDDGRLESQLYAYSMEIDDYLIKPLPYPLLEAHIEAILRRTRVESSRAAETVGALHIDYEGRTITLAGQPLTLTAKEFDMMAFMIKHKGMVLSRDKILDSVWGFDYVGSYRSVDTLIKNLRAKLTEQYSYIRTIYGVGYCFEAPEREV